MGHTLWDLLTGRGSPLGPTRRLLAVIVVLVGMLTFFLPLVRTRPPVLHTTDWSPFEIVHQMYLGHLPEPICERCGEPAIRSLLALPFDVSVVYGLMLVALISLCFFGRAALAWIGVLGVFFSLKGGTNFAAKWGFEWTFYGHPLTLESSDKGPVFYGWLTISLLSVMGALLLIALDEESNAKLGKTNLDDKNRPVS